MSPEVQDSEDRRSLISADLLEEQPQDIVDEVLEYLDTFDNGKSHTPSTPGC